MVLRFSLSSVHTRATYASGAFDNTSSSIPIDSHLLMLGIYETRVTGCHKHCWTDFASTGLTSEDGKIFLFGFEVVRTLSSLIAACSESCMVLPVRLHVASLVVNACMICTGSASLSRHKAASQNLPRGRTPTSLLTRDFLKNDNADQIPWHCYRTSLRQPTGPTMGPQVSFADLLHGRL